jgi:hypothetical protein
MNLHRFECVFQTLKRSILPSSFVAKKIVGTAFGFKHPGLLKHRASK